jgi:type III pantothenate kinase
MLLCVDIGNSSIKFGVFDDGNLTSKFSIPTKRDHDADEIAREVGDRMPHPIDAVIVCSVVPEVENAVAAFIGASFNASPRFVRSTDDLGLTINFNVETTGADRLVNSFAASEMYGSPCVVVSFGTATTIDAVNKDREFRGGLIAPGMKVSARALSLAASKLPDVVAIDKPANVIAQTTESAIRSGIVYGQIAMVEGLLRRVTAQMNEMPQVIATGGFAQLLASEIAAIDTVDADLTLKGLDLLNRKI